MKTKLKKILSFLPFIILGLTILLIFQLGYALANNEVPTIFGKAISYVPTKSMEDEIMAKDMIIVDTDFDEVNSGDVISFYANISGNRVSVTHRIISTDGVVFTTRGDNNDLTYSWETDIPIENIIGVYHGQRSAFIGHIYGSLFAGDFNILFILIILIFVIIMGLEVVNIVKNIQDAKQKEEKEKMIEEAKQKLLENEDKS